MNVFVFKFTESHHVIILKKIMLHSEITKYQHKQFKNMLEPTMQYEDQGYLSNLSPFWYKRMFIGYIVYLYGSCAISNARFFIFFVQNKKGSQYFLQQAINHRVHTYMNMSCVHEGSSSRSCLEIKCFLLKNWIQYWIHGAFSIMESLTVTLAHN